MNETFNEKERQRNDFRTSLNGKLEQLHDFKCESRERKEEMHFNNERTHELNGTVMVREQDDL